MENATIKVHGMTCQGCVASVTKILSRNEGVGAVQVSLDAGEAKIEFDSEKISLPKLRAALDAAGYPAS